MKVLVTGAFGNVGFVLLKRLMEMPDIRIVAFDVKNDVTLKRWRKIGGKKSKMDVIWGDVRRFDDVLSAVQGVDTIVHLATIIAPKSEEILEIAYEVNVGGTRNLIAAVKRLDREPRFIFASSVTVFGRTQHLDPPITVDHLVQPTDNYTAHKIECERMIRSELRNWVIL